MLTAFYMFRLVILTFHGEPRNQEKYENVQESKFVMTFPLAILTALSLFFWYTPNPIDPNKGWVLSEWITTPELYTPDNSRYDFMIADGVQASDSKVMYSETYEDAMHFAHYPAMILSLLMAGAGILLAFMFYQWNKIKVK